MKDPKQVFPKIKDKNPNLLDPRAGEVDPKCRKSNTKTGKPKRATERAKGEEPNVTRSRINGVKPVRKTLNTRIDEPDQAAERKGTMKSKRK